ncbi:MAG: cob(I)yrinic acid a,c-diamide adenosyltransferase [Deltaproteobacteria bacterium]|nr:cob(I)yrinic acid a,c-diamide adenosyltransferase [Deltaproteobacteria bacterium]
MRGDAGETGLAGGIRVSKSFIRVEAYGTVDELSSNVGFARSICPDEPTKALLKEIQRELFLVGSALATPPESPRKQPVITADMVDRLTAEIHRIEAMEGVLDDWSIPGEHTVSAALDVARTVCRRAERCAVRLAESGEHVRPVILAYLNRLSDLLWILGRLIEKEQGLDARLRTSENAGPRWSRAW